MYTFEQIYAQEQAWNAIKNNDREQLHALCDAHSFSLKQMNNFLQKAGTHGAAECVSYLLSLFNPTSNIALKAAIVNKQTNCVKLLMAVVIPDNIHDILWSAARVGNKAVLKEVLTHNFSTDDLNGALAEASAAGNIATVAVLLPMSDPKANHSEALQWAVLRGEQAIMDVLYPLSNPEEALHHIHETGTLENITKNPFIAQLFQRVRADEERQIIEDGISDRTTLSNTTHTNAGPRVKKL